MSDDYAATCAMAREMDCQDRHRRAISTLELFKKRQDQHHDLLIEVAGRTGKNGKIGELEKDMSQVQETMERISRAIEAQERVQAVAGIKLALLLAGASTVAVAAVGIFFKFVLGGV